MNLKKCLFVFVLPSLFLAACFGQPAAPQPTEIPSPYFEMTEDSPLYFSHPSGCEGMWVAGTVTNFSGAALESGAVNLSGSMGIETSFPGFFPDYGTGGYEIQISSLVEEHHGIFLQIIDFDGNPISELAGLRTYNDCAKNLIIINWTQVK